jgi:hypothetical protein
MAKFHVHDQFGIFAGEGHRWTMIDSILTGGRLRSTKGKRDPVLLLFISYPLQISSGILSALLFSYFSPPANLLFPMMVIQA